MEMYEKRLKEFKSIIKRVEQMDYLIKGVLYWDRLVAMPEGAVDVRNNLNSFLGSELYHIVSGSAFRKYTAYLRNNPLNNKVTDAMISRITRNSYFSENTPEDKYHEYLQLIGDAEKIWTKAKKENDFGAFEPCLEKIFSTFTSFARYWGYQGKPYDALMSYYEPDSTCEKLDELVDNIKPLLIEKTRKIRDNGLKKSLKIKVPVEVQEKVWKEVLSDLGFDFSCGRIDTGSFPIVLAYSPYDVRIINEYRVNDIKTGIGNILHSGAKGIYTQSVDKSLEGTLLAGAPTMLMEESVARFYERILGKSRGFTDYIYDKFSAYTDALEGITKDEFYADFNAVNITPVRLDADSITEILHVIIRYEIERDVINGNLSANNIREEWNKKYEEYLGITPDNDKEGILQDIHWATGYVGYFPIYLSAEIIACSIAAAIEKEVGPINNLFKENRINLVYNWMKENIYKYGAVLSTNEICSRFTVEEGTEVYMEYIKNKC